MNFITISEQETIARITLNRPEKRNALNPSVLKDVTDAFIQLGNRSDIKVIILEANGKAFCAGADLEYLEHMSTYSITENLDDSLLLQKPYIPFLHVQNLLLLKFMEPLSPAVVD